MYGTKICNNMPLPFFRLIIACIYVFLQSISLFLSFHFPFVMYEVPFNLKA